MKRIFCSSCGLEIFPDENYRYTNNSDYYHDEPYMCFRFRDMGVF